MKYSGTAGVDLYTGTDASDELYGLAGNDTLIGGAGDDYLNGGIGNDSLDGGDGFDTVSYDKAQTAILVNLSLQMNYGFLEGQNTIGQGIDFLSNIERIIGSTFNDTIIGSSFSDTLDGGAGSDSLLGGDGDDNLIGGTGSDRLNGGNGSNVINGGAGIDFVDYSTLDLSVTVDLAQTGFQTITHNPKFPAISDQLIGIENIIGTKLGDTLKGNSAANLIEGGNGADSILGGAGNDTLLGGSDNDYLSGGDGNDVLNGSTGVDRAGYDQSFAGVIVNLGQQIEYGFSGAQNTGGAGWDTLSGIENVAGSSYRDTLFGSSANNELSGGAGNDVLRGEGGADRLIGGIGADALYGGTGSDTFIFAALNHSTVLSSGQDSIFDFNHAEADKIGLGAIDANATVQGDQAFLLVAAFTHTAGQLTSQFDVAAGNYLVSGDVNGDAVADFAFRVYADAALVQADFIL